jgi:hypothetical protein
MFFMSLLKVPPGTTSVDSPYRLLIADCRFLIARLATSNHEPAVISRLSTALPRRQQVERQRRVRAWIARID